MIAELETGKNGRVAAGGGCRSGTKSGHLRHVRLLETSPRATLLIQNEVVGYANVSAIELFGADNADQLLGKPLFGLIHPDFHAIIADRLRRVLKSSVRNPPLEQKMIRLDGSIIDVETISWSFLSGGHRLVAAEICDITERRRAESVLRDSEERFRSLFDDAPIAYHELDCQGVVRRVNRTECQLLGLAAEEILGRHASDFAADVKTSQLSLARKLSGEVPLVPFERWYRRGDESVFLAEVNENLIRDQTGRIIGIRTGLLDITDRVNAKQQLDEYAQALQVKNQELEIALSMAQEAATMKDRFLANVSHEVRTPLTAVIGMASLMLQTTLDEEQRECIETVVRAGETLTAIINDILDISRIEAGKLELNQIECNFSEILQRAARLLSGRALEKGLQLSVSIAEEIPLIVCDTVRLAQVLCNLLGNAIKFTDRGTVSIQAQIIHEGEGYIRCEVRDSGIGIEARDLGQLFQPFTQVDGSITRRFGGTGLGLAISKRIVEAIGGQIGVTSELGVGSCFWFTVPLCTAPGSGLVQLSNAIESQSVSENVSTLPGHFA